MEKNYNTDNFEQLLKETTDNFRMYPSRRVWHSIYNDLHPGRKWPSLAILLLLVTSIMYVGLTNSNQVVKSSNSTTVAALSTKPGIGKLSVSNDPSGSSATRYVKTEPALKNSIHNNSKKLIGYDGNHSGDSKEVSKLLAAVAYNNIQADEKVISKENDAKINSHRVAGIETIPTEGTKGDDSPESNNTNIVNAVATGSIVEDGTSLLKNNALSQVNTPAEINLSPVSAKETTTLSDKTKTGIKKDAGLSIEDKSWIEDFVLHNKKSVKNWKNKFSYQVYVTPSVGYRSLNKNTEYTPPPVSAFISNPSRLAPMEEYNLNHSSAINLEAGTNILLMLSKKIRFKTGIQLNYTNYRINAYELNHPTFTTLLLNDLENGYPVLSSRTTTMANTPGPMSKLLNNNTYQVSIPVGIDFKLAGTTKMKWYVGTSVQPTYITGGHAYLVSSDLKNYVTGEDLMRKFNLNGSIESFVSFKTKSGVILSAGPQVRYQFFSTYSKRYTYDEKLYNFGIKMGMTTNF